MTIFHHKLFTKGQRMNSSILHESICKLIHKKCHLKSYHTEIKYPMTLNIIPSVVLSQGTILLYNILIWIFLTLTIKSLYMYLCHVKMLHLDINHMDVIFTCLVTTFYFVWTTFKNWRSFIISHLTLRNTRCFPRVTKL